MSEYQHYEWQTIDRALSARQQAEVEQLSSHMDIVSSTQAVVTYSWGNFKHDPHQVLLKYFDAFLYDSNFGSRRLVLRLPKKLIDLRAMQAYLYDNWIDTEERGSDCLLHLNCDEDTSEWIETNSLLSRMLSLRDQIIQGDYRALYLVWLKAISFETHEHADEIPEPPLPTGLRKLDGGLQALVRFFDINPHLIAAAVGTAKGAESTPEADLESAIPKLTPREMENHLRQIVRGETDALSALKKKLVQLSQVNPQEPQPPSHTVPGLLKAAEELAAQEQQKARKDAARKRLQYLEKLSTQAESAWASLESLFQQKRGSAYQEATKLLVDLRDLSIYKKQESEFRERFHALLVQYGKSQAFRARLKKAGLL